MGTRGGEGRSFEDTLSGATATFRRPLVVAALLGFLALIAVALAFVWRQYDDAKHTAAHDLRSRAILAATVYDTYFHGQLETLSAIAAAPALTSGDVDAMRTYFAGFRPGSGTSFTAGIGWIDPSGHQRATSDPNGPITASLAGRAYFKNAYGTGKPVVADAVIAKQSRRRLIVMAVPTRGRRGHVTGVLAGGIVLRPSSNDARANDLGYAGLHVVDASGHELNRRDLAAPRNSRLVSQLERAKQGVLIGAHGLDGSGGRVVAFATSAAPKWTVVLDQPEGEVFGDARRTLLREVLLVCAAGLLGLAFFAWALRRARKSLRASRAQVVRWSGLTRSLNGAADPDEVYAMFLRALAAEYPDGVSMLAVPSSGGEGGVATSIAPGSRALSGTPPDRIAASVVGLVASAEDRVALTTTEDVRRALGVETGWVASAYGVSLKDGDPRRPAVGLILFPRERALDANALGLLDAYADLVEQALGRVRRHEQEHDAAVLLQQSLLPDRLPEAPGIELAAHYRAGAPNTKVGGDWYDVVVRPDGIVHMTVGDVAGRGIDAAISMGQLRNAFRAYALEYLSPAEVVERLGRHVAEDQMATTVCVAYDPCTRELAFASAGHPPPLLLDGESGEVARLEASYRGPLGWRSSSVVEHRETVVSDGTTLALYTDGLVEHRYVGIDDGIDRLAAALSGARGRGMESAVDSVVAEVAPNPEDDVALLLVSFGTAPATLRLEIPADPLEIRRLRRRVHGWLDQRAVDEGTQDAAVLALNEACANSIEHGYRGTRQGTISIELAEGAGVLTIAVEDRGRWLEPRPNPNRGRGIMLMRHLMRKTEIHHRRGGTRVELETPV